MVFGPSLVKELGKALEELFAVSSCLALWAWFKSHTSSLLRCSFGISATLQWNNSLVERTIRDRYVCCFEVWGVGVVPHVLAKDFSEFDKAGGKAKIF